MKPWVKVSTCPVGKYRDTSRYPSRGWNAFFTLLLSAILFFGSYGLVLILTHEPLVIEIVNQIFGKVKKFISL